jgi:S-(hydroxymethyl)glutathione dehydrogenase/alcohol dehydrogenase
MTLIKAAILVEQGKPLIVDDVSFSPLEVGQVLVKIHVSGICGSQLGEIIGVKGPDKYLPHLLGHEACGTVVDIGPGVKHVKKDDLVVMHWRKGLGIESEPPKYFWRGKKLNSGLITTFSNFSVVSENRLTCVPPHSNRDLAALFGCAITTGFGVIENNAKLKIGESLLVYGAGGVGLNIIQASALLSAFPIIAVDLHQKRLELAMQMGASHAINSSTQNVGDELKKILSNDLLDCFIDNTGLPSVIEFGYECTKKDGRVILVGVPKDGALTSLFTLPMHFGKTILGSHGGESLPNQDIPRYSQLFVNKQIDMMMLVTERYPLEQINLAISRMRSGELAGRCMIDME